MEMLRILVIAWGAVGAALLVLLGYRGTLTRYEEDQIFLNDAVSMESQQQSDIQRKLLKIRPSLVAMVWTIGALTVVILGVFFSRHDCRTCREFVEGRGSRSGGLRRGPGPWGGCRGVALWGNAAGLVCV